MSSKLKINRLEKLILKNIMKKALSRHKKKLREISLKLDYYISIERKTNEQKLLEKDLIKNYEYHKSEIKEHIELINKL